MKKNSLSLILSLFGYLLSLNAGAQVKVNVNNPTGTITAKVIPSPDNPPPYYFTWSTSNEIIFEEENQIGTSGIFVDDFRTYCLVVRNKQSCEAQDCFTICPDLVQDIIVTHASPESSFGSIEIIPISNISGFSYQWNSINLTGATQTQLDAGNYQVTITNDIFGCSQVENIQVKQCGAFSPTMNVKFKNAISPSSHCASDGAIQITVDGGTAPYTFSWTSKVNSDFTATTQNLNNIPTAEYCVTVSDFHCATATLCHKILPQKDVNLSLNILLETSENCSRAIDLEVSGGTLPYQYQWSNGSTVPAITGLSPGQEYCLTVTDATSCQEIRCINVGFPASIVVVPSIVGTCQGTTNGSINLNITNAQAPFQFLWSTGATTKSINNLAQGSYSLTLVDANNCSLNQDFEVESNVAVKAEVTPACLPYYQQAGMIELSPSGGTPPYTYNWSPDVSNNHQATNLDFGNYQITVTDANGCFRTLTAYLQNLEVTQPEWTFVETPQDIRQGFLQSIGILIPFHAGTCDQRVTCENSSTLLNFNSGIECSQNGFNWGSCPCNNGPNVSPISIRCQIDHELVEQAYYISTLIDGPYEVNNICYNKLYCLYQGISGFYFLFESQEEIPCFNIAKRLDNELLTTQNNELPPLSFTAFPNPFQKTIQIELFDRVPMGNGTLEIFNQFNQPIRRKNILLSNGKNNIFELEVNECLAPGIYFLRLTTSDGRSGFTKVIRQ